MNRKALIGRKIKDARLALGLSQENLGRLYGCSDVAISKIERAATGLNIDDLERIAHILGQPLDYFISESVAYEQRPMNAILKELEAISPIAIPVLDQEASAGEGAPIQEYAYWSPPRVAGRNIKALKVRGSCLLPALQDGDVVFFDTDAMPRDGQLVVAVVDDTLCLKRFREQGGERWLETDDKRIQFDDAQIQGVVISFQRWLS